MALQIQGASGTVVEVDGATFKAIRVVPKPLEFSGLGHYRLSTTVGLLAAQAVNGTLFSFRWADATRFCVLHKVRLAVLQTGAATATIMPRFQVFIARGFTASDSAGTAVVLTGNNMKKRTAGMGTTLITDIRKSSAAAGLTVGTRVLDSDAVLELPTNQTITTPNNLLYERHLDFDGDGGLHPFVLAANEGFIVRGPTTAFGAAGTADLVVEAAWSEVIAY
jgi:hypothetical protein